MFKYFLILLVTIQLTISPASAQYEGYGNHDNLSSRLRQLSVTFPGYTKLTSLTKTEGQKDIWLLTIGPEDHPAKPAIVIAGGIEGNHLLGAELSLSFAEMLLGASGTPEIQNLLAEHTFYILPDMSPDAREQYFSELKYERKGNANSAWSDRSGSSVDHPFYDLNADGMISVMRISDPSGEWIEHPDDGRVMIKAKKAEGQQGKYSLYPEGIDILRNERWSEAGVEFNRNFSFRYPVFTRGAGVHALSEDETRAVAQFLFEANNVYAVFSFGPANNLKEPLKYDEKKASGRILGGILQEDAHVNAMVSSRYREITGDISGSSSDGTGGDFFQWAYFHYGRHSFSTPGWQVPSEPDNSGPEGKNAGDSNPELKFLRWAEKENIDNVFIPWEKVNHPLFPELEVEVGGIYPFAIINPPYNMIGHIAGLHYDFLIELAGMRPVVEILNVKTEELGKGVYRLTADITNTGIMPTVSELGERSRWVKKTVVRLETGRDQQVLGGKSVEVLTAVEGGKKETRSWLIRGRGEVKLRAGAENTGFKEISVKL
jgi:hypothetical protein